MGERLRTFFGRLPTATPSTSRSTAPRCSMFPAPTALRAAGVGRAVPGPAPRRLASGQRWSHQPYARPGNAARQREGEGAPRRTGGRRAARRLRPYQYVYLLSWRKEHRVAVLATEPSPPRRPDADRPAKAADRAGRSIRRSSARGCSLTCGPSARAADKPRERHLKTRLLQDLTTLQPALAPALRDAIDGTLHRVETALLDQELVELILALPPDAIVRDGWSATYCGSPSAGPTGESAPPPEEDRLSPRRRFAGSGPSGPGCRASSARRRSAPARTGMAGHRTRFFDVCEGNLEESGLFWRVLNAEAWLRVSRQGAALPGGAAARRRHRVSRRHGGHRADR